MAPKIVPPWTSADGRVALQRGDCIDVLSRLPEESVDLVFADPPYFLSNGGTTCKSGRRVLKPNGTIWVSGTLHVIHSVGFAMQQLGLKLLNEIAWEKPNPPPNLSCRYFTHSTETLLWAARDRKSKHYFDYKAMRAANGNKQMKTVWRMLAPGRGEKLHGKHPTQKPIELLARIVVASCPADGVVLDPFNGSGTTGVAALMCGRRYIGIERKASYLNLTRRRLADVPHATKG